MVDNNKGQPITLNNRQRPKKKKRIFLKIFLVLLFLGCAVFLVGAGIFYSYAKDAPKLEVKRLEDSSSSRLLDIKGNVIDELGVKKRETVTIKEMPKQLKDAVTSIEDKRFNKHLGIDPIRIVGAALSNMKGNNLQGGSTLTQQLIKLSYFSHEVKDQNIQRKAQEAWLSIQLERKASKDQILNYYINKVYMSNGLYGMETASKTYYGKPLDELSLDQTALLAGMPQAPNDYDPYASPDKALERRNLVLSEMYKDKAISQKQYNDAIKEPINHELQPLENPTGEKRIIDNYVKQVIEEVKKKTKKDIYRDGMDVYTNIDLEAQTYLYNLVNSNDLVQFPDDELQTAITVIDVKNGQVKAQIGGRKIPDDVQLGKNRAVTTKRDFGSTVKPLTDYAPAFEYLNYSTGKILIDEPYNYKGTKIPVKNYDNRYLGAISVREALVDSRNVPAVKTLEKVGIDKAREFLKGLNIEHKDADGKDNFTGSMAISGEIPSVKMAAAYAAFANGGLYYEPTYINKIVYLDGTEEKFESNSVRAMSESTAYMITDVLKDVLIRGTGTFANIPELTQAGKTGTSNYPEGTEIIGDQYSGVPDISFVGYSTNYAISVWTGYDKYNHAISYEYHQIAMYLYKHLMSFISSKVENSDWNMPENVVRIGNELYLKNHTNDQGTWAEQNSYWNDSQSNNNYQPPASSSSASPPVSQEPPTSQSTVEVTPPEPEPSNSEPAPPTPPESSEPAPPGG